MTLLENLIVLGILSIAATAIFFFVHSQIKTSLLLEGSSECNSAAQSAIDNITAFGVRDNVLPPFTSTTDPSGATLYNSEKQFTAFAAKMTPEAAALYWSFFPIVSGNRVANSHLILGAATYLQNMFNANPNYCSTDTQPLPSVLLPSTTTSLKNPVYTLKIIPTFDDGTTTCIAPQRIAPLGKPVGDSNRYGAFDGSTNMFYQAIVTIAHDKPDGNGQGTCAAQGQFRHQRDDNNSAAPSIVSIQNGSGALNPGSTPPTSCGDVGMPASSPYRTIIVTFNTTSIEPGSVPLCSGVTTTGGNVPANAGGANRQPCGTFKFVGQAGPTVVASSASTLTTVTFNQLMPDRIYTLDIETVDTAANVSPPATTQFIIDSRRPTIQRYSTDNAIGMPGSDSGKRRYDPPVTTNWVNSPIQCLDEDATLTALISGSDPISINQTGCSGFRYVGVAPTGAPSGCSVTVNPIGHTAAQVYMEPRDVCGTGVGLAYNWDVLLNFTTQNLSPIFTFGGPDPYEGPAGQFYKIAATATNPNPRRFTTECDCKTSLQEGQSECYVTTPVSPGCRAPAASNFSYRAWDACADPAQFQIKSARYEVYSRKGESCRTRPCVNGLICAQEDEGVIQRYTCYDPADYQPAVCNVSASQSPPYVHPTCMYPNSLYECDITGVIEGSSSYQAGGVTCADGSDEVTNYTITVTGMCNSAGTRCQFSSTSLAMACTANEECTTSITGRCIINKDCTPRPSSFLPMLLAATCPDRIYTACGPAPSPVPSPIPSPVPSVSPSPAPSATPTPPPASPSPTPPPPSPSPTPVASPSSPPATPTPPPPSPTPPASPSPVACTFMRFTIDDGSASEYCTSTANSCTSPATCDGFESTECVHSSGCVGHTECSEPHTPEGGFTICDPTWCPMPSECRYCVDAVRVRCVHN